MSAFLFKLLWNITYYRETECLQIQTEGCNVPHTTR